MKRMLLAVAIVVLACSPVPADTPAVSLAEPWNAEYAGEQAAGKHVIGLWQFNAGAETEDSSGHGLRLTLRGAQPSPHGRFGGGLESFRGFPLDIRHGATVKSHPRLSPTGAFTLEMWIKPKPDLNEYGESFLLDKKYVAHDDYQLILGAAQPAGQRTLRACLGFGSDSATWFARPMRFEPGTWYHLAFTYDGQGTGSFFINGQPQGSATFHGRAGISPGRHGLSIGDRVGSNYHGFPGFIDQVRICAGALEFRQVKLERISDRSCFVRMEPGAALRLAVSNLRHVPLPEARLTITCAGTPDRQLKVAGLAPGATTTVDIPVDTTLRPGLYSIAARFREPSSDLSDGRETFEIRIVPRPTPRFPVVMWGVYGNVIDELPRLKQMGFTHALGPGADYGAIWKAGAPTAPDTPERMAETKRMLDQALAADFSVIASLSPGSWLRSDEHFSRINRQGQAPTDKKRVDICGLFPEIRTFCRNVGTSVGNAYGRFPAFVGALVHTEVRDQAYPCFHTHDREAYRQSSGAEIPAEVAAPTGVDYAKLANFPASHVIPDNHPLYTYYRWYWKQGDGWNELNSAVSEGLKSAGGNRLWTFHDPAVRTARVYGSGGAVDYLSQWTYSYPDPIRIGLATDELLATAAGAATRQQVMKMTQIIWYRGQTAPAPKPGAQPLPYQAAWEQQQPDAPFITVAPMHLREAFWTKIARPIRGIMYHGWQSLVPCDPSTGYRFTHAQTQHELARLTGEVLRPLGPVLLEVPGVKSDVAFLQSFASEMFARRGTYGWGRGWAGDAYHVMLYAHLQPEIVFDETISQRGLDGFRVLVMCDCDVITETMRQRIAAFQARGGLVIGDERTAPAIKPNLLIPTYSRTGHADDDKAALLTIAAKLRTQLDARYSRPADTSNPEVIPYLRRYHNTDYVFVVNDRREFGQYVGQHGVVMENGLPAQAVLSIQRPDAFAYDLVASRALDVRVGQSKLTADLQLGPCDGRLLMITPRAIDAVRVQGPATVERGKRASCIIEVTDAAGCPLDAVVPVEIHVRDAEGALAEFSGYYAAVDGRLTLDLDIAANDVPGTWQVEVRELASGRRGEHFFRVAGPTPWPPKRKPMSKELANPVQPQG